MQFAIPRQATSSQELPALPTELSTAGFPPRDGGPAPRWRPLRRPTGRLGNGGVC